MAARRRAGRGDRRRIPRPAGDGVCDGGGPAAGRRAVGGAGAAGRLRGTRLVTAAVGRARVDHRTDDGDGVGAAGRRDPGRYAALAAAAALLVGGICFVAGLVRIGFLADLLSRPVLVGYMTGVAFIMIGSQLGKVTGVSVEGDEFVDQVRSFINGLTACIGRRSRCRWRCSLCCWRWHGWCRGSRASDRDAAGDRRRRGILVGPQRDSGDRRDPERAADARAARYRIRGPSSAGDPGGGYRDRRVLRQRVDRPHVRGPPWPAGGCQRRAAGAGRLQRRDRSDARISGQLQRQPHRARRRARQPHPAVFVGHAGVRACW